jgi:hypothetical protein
MGGVGGSAGNAFGEAIAGLCMKSVECGYYGDLQGCIDYYSIYFMTDIPECYAATVSYLDCIGGVTGCGDFSACYDDGDAWYDACR